MSAQGVFTNNYRVKFVEKSGSEVGNGTAFPMLVTLDQLAEILYRVKDAWFTSGQILTTSLAAPDGAIYASTDAASNRASSVVAPYAGGAD